VAAELHRHVAGIRLGHGGQPHLQAGAARGAFDLRNGVEDPVHVLHDAVGLRERAACRHDVVEHEAALIHLRQQVRAQCPVASVGGRQQRRAQAQQEGGARERPAKRAAVEGEAAAHHAAGLRGAGTHVPQQRQAQGRRPGDGEQKRGQQRDGDGDGERAEEASRNAGDRNEREKEDDRRDGGADQRHHDLAQGEARRLGGRLPAIAVQNDVLDHDDRIVDHQADGRGQAAERHQVEALARDPEREDRQRHRYGNHERGHHGGAPVAEEEEQDGEGQAEADHDCVPDTADAGPYQLRLVVVRLQLHPRRQVPAQLLHLCGDGVGNRGRIAGGLPRHVDEDRGPAIRGHGGVDGHDAGPDLGHIGHAHGRAGGRGPHDQATQLLGIVRLRAHQSEDEAVIRLVEAGRVNDVRRLHGRDQVQDGDARRLHARHVRNDVELGRLAALHRNGADSRRAVHRRLDLVGGKLP